MGHYQKYRPILKGLRPYKIYSLYDPHTGIDRYIGFTTTTLQERFRCHLKDVDIKSPQCHKNKWIRVLRKNGFVPGIRLLIDDLSKSEAIAWEILLIVTFKKQYRLTNNTDGGEGGPGYKFSKEKREELAAKRRGKKCKPCSEERKRKISASNKGRKLTDQQKLRVSIGSKKRFNDPSQREYYSVLYKGRKLTEDTKQKMSTSRMGHLGYMAGKKHSEETKLKMSDAHSGNKNHFYGKTHDEKARLKISNRNIGNKNASGKRSNEQIERIKLGMLLAKQRRLNGAL